MEYGLLARSPREALGYTDQTPRVRSVGELFRTPRANAHCTRLAQHLFTVRASLDLLRRLDAETQSEQVFADATWLAASGPDGSVPTYMRLLGRAYGFQAPLEAALAYTPIITALVDLRARSRSGLAAADLLTLGATATQLAALDESCILPFTNLADALGWLYVSERSTRVHGRIRDELVARHPQLAPATSYLAHSTNAAADNRWRELGVTLDRVAQSSRVADQILDAARDAYDAQLDWLDSLTRRTSPASCADPRG